jgi:hypothetical protein
MSADSGLATLIFRDALECDDGLVIGESIGALLCSPERLEKGVGRKDDLQMDRTNGVSHVEESVSQVDFRSFLNEEHGIQITGRHNAPPLHRATLQSGRSAVNSELTFVTKGVSPDALRIGLHAPIRTLSGSR